MATIAKRRCWSSLGPRKRLIRVGWKRSLGAVRERAVVEHRTRVVAGDLVRADVAVAGAVVAPAIAVVAVIRATTTAAVTDYVFIVELHFETSFECMQCEIR